MGGLLVLFLIGLYLWGAYKVVRRIKPVWGKTLAVVAVVLIPTWDMIPGYIYLKYLCATEGGVRVNKLTEGVEGFRANGVADKEFFKTYGYKFIEEEWAGNYYRYSMSPYGDLIKQEILKPTAKYEIKRATNQLLILAILRHETSIVDSATEEKLATKTHFSSYGGWLMKATNPLLGYGPSCTDEGTYKEFYSALKPAHSPK
jgi:hypothetical protein